MFLQIADRAQSEPLRFVTAHDERVSVVKSERLRHSNAELSERIANFLERQSPVRFQDFLGDRSSVFWIGIDLRGAQRFPNYDRAAHALAMFGRGSRIVQSTPSNLAEDIRFGEFF